MVRKTSYLLATLLCFLGCSSIPIATPQPQPHQEIIESVDMMRVLENGIKIKMVYIQEDNFSVDTKEDLENVVELIKKDKLINKYM